MCRSIATAASLAVSTLVVFAFPWAASDAAAFSQFERPDGQSNAKTGIVAVPLPPLPSATGDDPAPFDEPEGTDAGEVPLSPEDEDRFESDDPGSAPSSAAEERGPAEPKAAQPTAAPTGGQPYAETEPVAVPLPSEIAYGEADLPKPVADLRRRLLEIAKTGDIEKLRPYIEGGENGTVLSFGERSGNPIEFLKSASGDGKGIETLAILLELLEAGHAHILPGENEEIFVWPYFTQVAIENLTKPQLVELFELVTAGDYEAMKAFGAYNFYRVGISPDGKLQFFVAGD